MRDNPRQADTRREHARFRRDYCPGFIPKRTPSVLPWPRRRQHHSSSQLHLITNNWQLTTHSRGCGFPSRARGALFRPYWIFPAHTFPATSSKLGTIHSSTSTFNFNYLPFPLSSVVCPSSSTHNSQRSTINTQLTTFLLVPSSIDAPRNSHPMPSPIRPAFRRPILFLFSCCFTSQKTLLKVPLTPHLRPVKTTAPTNSKGWPHPQLFTFPFSLLLSPKPLFHAQAQPHNANPIIAANAMHQPFAWTSLHAPPTYRLHFAGEGFADACASLCDRPLPTCPPSADPGGRLLSAFGRPPKFVLRCIALSGALPSPSSRYSRTARNPLRRPAHNSKVASVRSPTQLQLSHPHFPLSQSRLSPTHGFNQSSAVRLRLSSSPASLLKFVPIREIVVPSHCQAVSIPLFTFTYSSLNSRPAIPDPLPHPWNPWLAHNQKQTLPHFLKGAGFNP